MSCPWLLYAKVVANVMPWGHDVGVQSFAGSHKFVTCMHAGCLLCSENPDAAHTEMRSRGCTFREHAKLERIIHSVSCRSAESSLPNILARTCGRTHGHMPGIGCLKLLLPSVSCLRHLQSTRKRLYTSKAVSNGSVFC